MCDPLTHLSVAARALCQLLYFYAWIRLVILPSRSSLLISMFVFDILQTPSGCRLPTWIPLATGLPVQFHEHYLHGTDPCREDSSCSSTQEFSQLLLNPKVHNRVHNSRQLDCVVNKGLPNSHNPPTPQKKLRYLL